MNHPLPTRFRDPIADPDRSLAAQYRILFGRDLPTPTRGQVETLSKALMRGDPLGDGWVAALRGEARSGQHGAATAGALPALFERGLTAGRAAVADAPPALRALLE